MTWNEEREKGDLEWGEREKGDMVWGKKEGRQGVRRERRGMRKREKGEIGDKGISEGRHGSMKGDDSIWEGWDGSRKGDEAFLPFSFYSLVASYSFGTISFVLRKFFRTDFLKVVFAEDYLIDFLMRFSRGNFPTFRFTEDCFVKLVISRKNLPQEHFSDLFMFG